MSDASIDQRDQRTTARGIGGLLLIFALLLLALLIGCGLLAPSSQHMFQDFGVELPRLTRFAVSPMIPVLMTLLFAFTIAKEFIPPLRRHRNLLNLMIIGFGLFMVVFYLLAIGMPLMNLMNELS